eukprot:171727_1
MVLMYIIIKYLLIDMTTIIIMDINQYQIYIINGQSFDKLKGTLSGWKTGYDAKVVCQSGSKCLFICISTACNNLKYLCLFGAIECMDTNTNSISGIDCPIIFISSTDTHMESLYLNHYPNCLQLLQQLLQHFVKTLMTFVIIS